MIEDKATAFDLAIGLYIWLSENYEGQWSEKYAAMSKMVGEYSLRVKHGLDEMSEYHYNNLTEDNWLDTFNDFCYYMDNKWDLDD